MNGAELIIRFITISPIMIFCLTLLDNDLRTLWKKEYKLLKLKRKLKPGDIFIFPDKNKLYVFDFYYFSLYKHGDGGTELKPIMYLRSETQSDKKDFIFLCGEKTIKVDIYFFSQAYNDKRIIKLG